MNTDKSKTIAGIIWAQMRELDLDLCVCMGINSLSVIENGLQFNVNGLSFKGVVQIVLNPADLYEVKFLKHSHKLNESIQEEYDIKRHETTMEVVSLTSDVHVEDLMLILNRTVECKQHIIRRCA